MSTEFELFKGKNLSSLFEDIYNNQISKKQKISSLIEELKKMIKHAGDVASVIASEKKTEGQDGFLTEFEKNQLLKELEETKQEVERVDDLEFELEDLKKKMK